MKQNGLGYNLVPEKVTGPRNEWFLNLQSQMDQRKIFILLYVGLYVLTSYSSLLKRFTKNILMK